ncbi:hypothetical protein [Micromonospora sp. NPDC048830]|uniref:hypothetical protein n=1 Tax=Micromonospora sp. NPDC048830 TaxID=3364257 RepID=UPI003712E7F0
MMHWTVKVLIAVVGAVVLERLVDVLGRRLAGGRYAWLVTPLHRACRVPAIGVVLFAASYATMPPGPAQWQRELRHLVLALLIGVTGWLIVRACT